MSRRASAHAQDGSYTPLSRPLFIYVKLSSLEDNESDVATSSATRSRTPTPSPTEAKFVPLSQEQIDEQLQKLEDATS